MKNKEQILTLTSKIERLQSQLVQIDKEIQTLRDFNGTGHLGVGLMGAPIGHISFGQLLHRYEDVLQGPLLALKQDERLDIDNEITATIRELSALFEKESPVVQQVTEKPWYPDTPGWTWYEHDGRKRPVNPDTQVLTMLSTDRKNKRYNDSDKASEWHWKWITGLTNVNECDIVAYATKN